MLDPQPLLDWAMIILVAVLIGVGLVSLCRIP